MAGGAWKHDKSSTERGYGYAWQKIRLQILKRDHGICQCADCKALGRIITATEVHHIKNKADGGTDHPDNLQATNHYCHERITATENGRSMKPRLTSGLDGWPVPVQ